MPALAAPVTQASHARIVDELGRRITGGALQVGDGMTVARLEEEFAASRTVVREAIRVLEAHGLVASRRRVGVIVQPRERWRTLDATVIAWTLQGPRRQELLVELTALRVAVEPVAAAQAARTAHPADRDELLRLATRLGELGARGAGDSEEYLQVDIAYHSLLLRAGGNALFAQLSHPIAEVLAGRAALGLTPGIPHVGTLEAHLATAQAIAAGDAAAAEAAAREHLTLVSGEVESL
ncbi:FadR/GntR family transcriptional regulator [Microbacterium lacticum]